ncbi:MAG: aspartate 1-decarboxylase [Eubacteriales bacterium]|nr:aspartate 1-decarboxylase [Eubacteriales bacterium]
MFIEMLSSKIHRATVTDANVEYVGSISIDEELIEKAKLRINQKVDIYDIDNGERFSTYVIKDERHSGCICLNGAAARKVERGHKIIICAYGLFSEEEAEKHVPIAILVDENNKIVKDL